MKCQNSITQWPRQHREAKWSSIWNNIDMTPTFLTTFPTTWLSFLSFHVFTSSFAIYSSLFLSLMLIYWLSFMAWHQIIRSCTAPTFVFFCFSDLFYFVSNNALITVVDVAVTVVAVAVAVAAFSWFCFHNKFLDFIHYKRWLESLKEKITKRQIRILK